jgi:L-asparaginase
MVVLGMGGTIAGRAEDSTDNVGYKAAQLGVVELVSAVYKPDRPFNIELEQVAQLDSKDNSFEVLSQLALRVEYWLSLPDVCGVVITHGTDTIEETAFFLQQVCGPAKPVVMTCAMRPASSFAPDGPQNLLDAFAVAQDPLCSGVVVVCGGRVHTARNVQKSHTYLLDAFSSGDTGCIGFVEEGILRTVGVWPKAGEDLVPGALKKIAEKLRQPAESWPYVGIVSNYISADGLLIDALIAIGAKGIVVAGTGNGTIHKDLEMALLRASVLGLLIVRSTRCANGRVISIPGGHFPDSAGLSPQKARIAMVLELITR